MEGIHEPLDPRLHACLRRAVFDHALNEPRRAFPALLHVGVPGGRAAVFAPEPGDVLDHALRTDVVAALLRRMRGRGAPEPLVWLTRAGDLDLQDVDAAWLAATRAAAAEGGAPVAMVVVTRHGWVDPRTGVCRQWKRLRER